MFDPNGFDKAIDLKYFDMPSLHTFDEEGCQFMEHLAYTPNIELFLFRSVQFIITHKWIQVKNFVTYLEFMPHMALLSLHCFWNVNIR